MTRSLISGKAFIGSIDDRLAKIQIAQSGHAHQFRHAVDFCRTRSAFSRFAIPANGQIVGTLGLNLMDGIQHDHAFGDVGFVLLEFARLLVTTP